MKHLRLNEMAWDYCKAMSDSLDDLRIASSQTPSGSTILDFGVDSLGGLEAGILLAEICLAASGQVQIVASNNLPGAAVSIRTDQPVAACIGSQYAGWQVSAGEYFAMGSGPMRALAANEPIIQELACGEESTYGVGVLESSKLPTDDVCEMLAKDCGIAPSNLLLCVAPTSSLAGTIQVVARSVETAMHKMHELGFDLHQIKSGFGIVPLPPVAADDLTGIGRTNDAILYGGEVMLWVESDDAELAEIVAKVPSMASLDFGVPFIETFRKYEGDFYKIDPHLFSPAKICLVNLRTGRSFQAGELRIDLLQQSFHVS